MSAANVVKSVISATSGRLRACMMQTQISKNFEMHDCCQKTNFRGWDLVLDMQTVIDSIYQYLTEYFPYSRNWYDYISLTLIAIYRN